MRNHDQWIIDYIVIVANARRLARQWENEMTEIDIDRLYREIPQRDIENAGIVLFCIVAGICIVLGAVIGYIMGGGM